MNPSDKSDLVNILATQVGEYIKPTKMEESGCLVIVFQGIRDITIYNDTYKTIVKVEGYKDKTFNDIEHSMKAIRSFHKYFKMIFNHLYADRFLFDEGEDIAIDARYECDGETYKVFDITVEYDPTADAVKLFSEHIEVTKTIEFIRKSILVYLSSDDTDVEEDDDSDED